MSRNKACFLLFIFFPCGGIHVNDTEEIWQKKTHVGREEPGTKQVGVYKQPACSGRGRGERPTHGQLSPRGPDLREEDMDGGNNSRLASLECRGRACFTLTLQGFGVSLCLSESVSSTPGLPHLGAPWDSQEYLPSLGVPVLTTLFAEEEKAKALLSHTHLPPSPRLAMLSHTWCLSWAQLATCWDRSKPCLWRWTAAVADAKGLCDGQPAMLPWPDDTLSRFKGGGVGRLCPTGFLFLSQPHGALCPWVIQPLSCTHTGAHMCSDSLCWGSHIVMFTEGLPC